MVKGLYTKKISSATECKPVSYHSIMNSITEYYRYVVGLVFGFEHLLLVAAILLQWSIHPIPKWVRVAIQRREYLALKRKATSAALHDEGDYPTREEGGNLPTAMEKHHHHHHHM